ncbi:MAG: hypothetical protein K1Y02_08560 [Candidatus Hydrogenedentes bacterium]|nr:hypothetical protein [Candidatus Hydrogenedentota bacterium]
MPNAVDLIEPALCLAKELLVDVEKGEAKASAVLRSVRACVELFRPPQYTEYGLGRLVDSVCRASAREPYASLQTEGRICVGDISQLQILAQGLVRSAVLEAESELVWSLELDGDVSYIQLTIDGPGRFSDVTDFGFGISLPFSTIEELWTIATRGGRIDRSHAAFSLRLKGIRVVPENQKALAAWTGCVGEAEKMLRLVDAGESGIPREQAIRQVVESVSLALAQVDAARKGPEPSDLRALIDDAMTSSSDELTEAGIVQEMTVSDNLPPVAVRRNHIAATLSHAVHYALSAMKHGGTFTVLADYRTNERTVEVVVDLAGKMIPVEHSPYLASIRRAIKELHAGRFETAGDEHGLTIQLEIPDAVGRALDEWIPGFERFSDRSKQMLRLLKSGGPTPPEEFILAGVLEEELERWLLPAMSVAPATTLAHELSSEPRPLAGSVADRRAKALAQIARGRPKKEVCQPAYAAEILWAFRIDERHRKALHADRLSESVLQSLCEELLKPQIDYTLALRMVAQALA